jgi:hypothetical protein
LDYIQHGARAGGVRRFAPIWGRSVPPPRPFYAENAAAGSSAHLVYWKNLSACSAFAWGVFAGYAAVLHGARRLRPQASTDESCLEKYLSCVPAHHRMS